VACVTGKRTSPSVQGSVEYLVHWQRNGAVVVKEWVLDDDLRRADETALARFESVVLAKSAPVTPGEFFLSLWWPPTRVLRGLTARACRQAAEEEAQGRAELEPDARARRLVRF